MKSNNLTIMFVNDCNINELKIIYKFNSQLTTLKYLLLHTHLEIKYKKLSNSKENY